MRNVPLQHPILREIFQYLSHDDDLTLGQSQRWKTGLLAVDQYVTNTVAAVQRNTALTEDVRSLEELVQELQTVGGAPKVTVPAKGKKSK